MSDALDLWTRAGERGDAEAARAALAEDVMLVSPVTDRFTFQGADEVVGLLQDVFQVITDIRYLGVEPASFGAVAHARARIGDMTMHEVQLIELDADGRIGRLTLFFRPLVAGTRFLREMGPRVARRQGHPVVARTLTATGAFLDSVARTGDQHFVPLGAPPSAS